MEHEHQMSTCTCPPGWPMPLHIRCPVGHESDVERHYSRCPRYNPHLHAASSWCPVPDCIGNARARRAVRPTDPSGWDMDWKAR